MEVKENQGLIPFFYHLKRFFLNFKKCLPSRIFFCVHLAKWVGRQKLLKAKSNWPVNYIVTSENLFHRKTKTLCN